MASRSNDHKDKSFIPILDGSNYSEWYQQMQFLLRSRDLLDVCENPLGQEATPTAITKWNKLSFKAITLVTSQVNQRVFLEIINSETSDKANLLWTKINEQYGSKRALKKGRLESVSIKVPLEIPSYIILGKLAGDMALSQIVELLTLNDDLIGRPDQVLSCLQEYIHLQTSKPANDHSAASALLSSIQNHPYKIMYYCANGKHNPKCMTHKKEECYAKNPHLRPP
ncbi:hypothetical protein O181_004789 [Austropuccinia psidii MF-1]|uniref:DUF4219 domain-containing protein n=1 Tax=Austropuccinia psidii MF-1 TaxID=1389203 RepID=A0A9Q3BGG5_9BASI|nr:hypothetical protein [Austropuccinia psidii MF-1]